MSELDPLESDVGPALVEQEGVRDSTHLWVISYSDFMTILMIFFLILFAHRVWEKKASWDTERVAMLSAAQEAQRGMVERLARLAHVDVLAERVDIHLPDALLFDAGSADLRDSARVLLAALSPELARFKGEIVVEGHTDDRPIGAHARFASNWELSVARAFSVIKSLSEDGIDPEHLAARGYGPYRPRAPNDTPEHRAENRRIEIILLNPPKA